MRSERLLTRRAEKWLLVALLLLGFALRVVALDEAPPGLRYDELQNYLMAGRVLSGERPLYFAESWGHEPLYHYLQAGSLAALGESDWSLRLPSVWLGMIALAGTWLAAKSLLGQRVGLLTLTFLSLSFWAIFYGRVGLRVGGVTAFASLTIYFLWRSWERPLNQRSRGLAEAVFTGLFLAGGIYTYLAGRVLPAIFLGFLLFTAVFYWPKFKPRWSRFALAAAVALLLCWPLWLAVQANPTGEQRLVLLNEALVSLEQGDPGPVADLTVRALGMYVVLGEQDWLYNAYGRPVFGWFIAPFFLGGLAWALWHWRQPRSALLLLWFLGGTGPSMIAPPAASVTHSVVAQPAAYIILGIGLAGVWRWLARSQKRVSAVLIILVAALTGVGASRAYFVTWNTRPEVGELYQAGITAVADAVQNQPKEGAILVGGPFVNYWQPWNALNFDLATPGDVRRVRWFNPAGAWIWPSRVIEATYYFPDSPLGSQQFDPELLAVFQADALATSPLNSAYVQYTLQDSTNFEQLLTVTASGTAVAWPPDYVGASPLELPVNFGNRLLLLSATQPELIAEDTVRFITFWQVEEADPSPLVAFVHLTPDGVMIWGQQDWLDVRMAGLQPGDRFAQVHKVPLQPNTPPNLYYLQIGLYHPDTLERLPIMAAGDMQVDRIFTGALTLDHED